MTVFVDTNVLIYAYDPQEPERRSIAQDLLAMLWQTRAGVVSTQVLQEFYNVVTRKLTPPMEKARARGVVELYGTWPVVATDVALISAAADLDERHSISFWDALIVEAARRAGADVLVTEDIQPGTRITGIKIENPFA